MIFMELQIRVFLKESTELKQSYPRSSTCLSSLYSLKHYIMSKTLFITRQNVFAHAQTSAKNLNVTESTYCSSSSCTAVPICTTMKILDCGLFLSTYSVWHGGTSYWTTLKIFPHLY